jgi:hypothetical protein
MIQQQRKQHMKKPLMAVAFSALALQACVMAPPQPDPVMVQQPPVMVQQAPGVIVSPPASVVVPPGVVYVAPSYPAPAVGFVWEFHPRFGWGWRHPHRGWHRGWR